MFEEGQEILDKRYRVLRKLGGGAFGEIYKGRKQAFILEDKRDVYCFSMPFIYARQGHFLYWIRSSSSLYLGIDELQNITILAC